ncbi:MAG: glycoside hydrolase family 130 protein [Planctomycetota bacterium]|jgi:beta-1,4-mannooligosaccharide/beta-1,4-mannosyl-N-acetylglucosamine phosphorylase
MLNIRPLSRHGANPLITPKDVPFECAAVFNSGATMFEGKILLLLRIENFKREMFFHVATSDDGVTFEINPTPINYPLHPVEARHGGGTFRFDPRITKLEDTYYICHATFVTGLDCLWGMARTTDFVNFDPIYTSLPANRNAMLFPEKINGLYARLDRPMLPGEGGGIWLSYSPDLRYWGDHMPVILPCNGWNYTKLGPGATPIKTEQGWLEIYHATARNCSVLNYFLGAVLLDLEDPSKVIGHSDRFLLQPEEPYECVGQVPNVVFTCGAVETGDGDLNIYYAGADTCMCLATAKTQEIIDLCLSDA